MSDKHPTHEPDTAGTPAADHIAATAHGDAPTDHGHDDHGHDASTLGPIDVAAWGAGILGVGVAVAMAVAFMMATSGVG